MAILSWVSQRALWLRRISLAMNFRRSLSAHFLFDLHARKSKVSLKRSLSYRNINAFFFFKIRFEVRQLWPF